MRRLMAVLLVFIALFVQASCKSEENADEKALEIRSGILASDINFPHISQPITVTGSMISNWTTARQTAKSR